MERWTPWCWSTTSSGRCFRRSRWSSRSCPSPRSSRPRAADGPAAEFLYEPGKSQILDYVLPLYVETQIHRALLESIASEFGARMTAMENATKNATEMIDRLTLQYNRARQASITKELMEIVGGAEALKG